MTQAEAEKAAATFEFPPFTAKPLRIWLYTGPDQFEQRYHTWGLHVGDPKGAIGPVGLHYAFATAAEWLEFYDRWQRRQREVTT